jgi:hypothetical protein
MSLLVHVAGAGACATGGWGGGALVTAIGGGSSCKAGNTVLRRVGVIEELPDF